MDVVSLSLFSTALVIGGSFVLSIDFNKDSKKDITIKEQKFYWTTIIIVFALILCLIFIVLQLQPKTPTHDTLANPLVSFSEEKVKQVLELVGTNDLCEKSAEDSGRTRQEIFFLETSGEECLTARQACSAESASRANPEADVVVYMEGTGPLAGEWYTKWKEERKNVPVCVRSCSITKSLLNHYKNIRIVKKDLLGHLEKTPLEPLLSNDHHSGGIRNGQFPLAQRSDLVRVALMWKRGGMYLDLDVVVYRPLYCLNNTIGLKDWISVGGRNWVENSVMTFTAGNPYLKFLMEFQALKYRSDEYFSLGPPTLTAAFMNFCKTGELPDPKTGGSLNCGDDNTVLHFQPPYAFFALDNWERNVFFSEEAFEEDFKALNKSYLSHIFEAKSGVAAPPNSLYARLAQTYCPITYKMAIEELGVF